jgi:hypothetical protein
MPKHAEYKGNLLRFAQASFVHYRKRAIRYQLSPRRLYDAVGLLEAKVTGSLNEALKLAVVAVIDTDQDAEAVTKIVDAFAPADNSQSREVND